MPERTRRPRKAPRNNAIDGLRAFAIIAIVLYHLSIPWLPSGHMGVVLFLVIGGYLASSMVLRTIRHEGKISLPRTWAKRIVRVWPAMAVMCVFTVALCVIFNHVLLTKLKPDLLPSLLLSNNIAAIVRGASYFDNLGGTSPLTHLWYLGLDIQFFVVWTAICTFLSPKGRSTRICRRLALGLALVSAILMAVFFNPNGDPTRVYYGPDTRAFAPLLGAWLGLAWPLGGRPVRLTGDPEHEGFSLDRLPLDILGIVGLVGLIAIMVLVPKTSPVLFWGGMLLAAVFSVLLLMACLSRKSLFNAVFSLKPIVWLGTRSFGIYLWHFPLFQIMKVTNNQTPAWVVVAAVLLSLGLAELSVRLIERPLSRHEYPLVATPLLYWREDATRYVAFLPAALTAIALVTSAIGLIIVPDETAVPADALVSTGESAGQAMDMSQKGDRKKATDSAKSDTDSATTTTTHIGNEATQDLTNLPTGAITLEASSSSIAKGHYTPTIVADSVLGDAEWYLSEHMPDALLDSYIGRRPDQALDVLKGYLDQDVVGDIVILDSFSNTPTTDDVMKELIECCGDRKVFLVNVRIPEVEQEQINDMIDKYVDMYDNVELIDWYGASEGHPDWLYADGEHLTPAGQPHYVDLISNAIAYDFARTGGTVKAAEGEEEEEDTTTITSTSDDEEEDSSTTDEDVSDEDVEEETEDDTSETEDEEKTTKTKATSSSSSSSSSGSKKKSSTSDDESA